MKRTLGAGLLGASLVGIIGTLIAIALVIRASGQVQMEIVEGLDITLDLLQTTDESLTLLRDTLGEASATFDTLESTVGGVEATTRSTTSLLSSLEALFADDLPGVIEGTQSSVAATSESAALLEGFLRTLSSIPFAGINYEPEVTLTQSVAAIEESLEGLPSSFETIAGDLDTTATTLGNVSDELDDLEGDLSAVEASIDESVAIVDAYSASLDDITVRVETLRETTPQRMRNTTILVVFVLVWFVFAQIGLAYQGREMMTHDYGALEARVTALEAAHTTDTKELTADQA